MNSPIAVNVPTKALKSLLSEHPEIEIKLQSMACEKIAEEIVRKTKSMDKASLETRAESILSGVIAKFNRNHTFPTAAKEQIGIIACDRVEFHASRIARDNSVRVDKQTSEKMAEFHNVLQLAINEEFKTTHNKLREEIRKIAREEFLSVLKEVKEL